MVGYCGYCDARYNVSESMLVDIDCETDTDTFQRIMDAIDEMRRYALLRQSYLTHQRTGNTAALPSIQDEMSTLYKRISKLA